MKLFARWMSGTCLAADANSESPNGDLQQTHAISFYDDVITVPSICDTVMEIQKHAQEIVSQIRCYLFG